MRRLQNETQGASRLSPSMIRRRSLTCLLVFGAALGPAVLAGAPPRALADATYAEQEGHLGANTFTDIDNASGEGTKVPAAAWVQVTCKVYDPSIASVSPDGYWYLIASAPWNNQYYAAANTFMNGDPWNGPYTHNTDWNVPDCGQTPPTTQPPPTTSPPTTTSPAVPQPSVNLTQGPLAPFGYAYSISLASFPADTSIEIDCFDSVSNSGDGFYQFTLTTDAGGNATTASYCYSADGPEHWVTANGYSSNIVTWSGGGLPTTTSAPSSPPSTSPSATAPPATAPAACGQARIPGASYYADDGTLYLELLRHYSDGSGISVVLDWAYFASYSSFVSWAEALPLNQSTHYSFPYDTDLFFSLGEFSVERTAANCWLVHAYYNFSPKNREHLPYLPLWLWSEIYPSASPFDIWSQGSF